MNTDTKHLHGHRGGTLTGFVVGLLVGLGLALSVAVYVTRVPVPFVDRGVTRKPADDAAEAERNKNWNPNAGLVVNAPPLPAPVVPQPPAAADTGASKDANADPATKDEAAQKPAANATTPKPDADPLGDLVKSRDSGGAVTADAPAGDAFTYFVQAGAFRSPDEAEAQRARLAMLGMAATITEREQAGRPVYRVRMGPFSQKAVAEATRTQLESSGVEAAMVRVQR